MEDRMLQLILCVTVVTVSAVYVHDGSTNRDNLDHVVTCPQGCLCSQKEMTAQCNLNYENYSFQNLDSWQLTRLRIHGDIFGWNLESSKLSVKEVIYGNKDTLQDEDREGLKTRFFRLTHLDISYVPIHGIAEFDFSEQPALKLLTLTNDNISHIEPKAFEKLPALEDLNLSNNQISGLSNDIFSKLTMLKKLNLRSNKLTVIDGSIFSGLSHLENLDLQNNEIRHLETFIYALYRLSMLDVRGNKIMYVSEEGARKLGNFGKVLIGKNPFWCTCNLRSLIRAYQLDPGVFDDSVLCFAPKQLAGANFGQLDVESLPCNGANITVLSLSSNVLYQGSLVLDCGVTGDFPLAVYWTTPWGESFTNSKSKEMFPEEYSSMKTDETYSALNLLVTSRVHVAYNGSLHIDKYRGHFSGEFTCVAVNLIGQSNKTISIGIETKLPFVYITSLFVGAFSGGSMLILAIIIGMVRLFVNKCLHSETCNCCCCSCDDVQIVEEKIKPEDLEVEVEVKAGSCDSSLDYTEYDPSLPPPDPPVNSPQLRLSPEKCHTPNTEELGEQTKVGILTAYFSTQLLMIHVYVSRIVSRMTDSLSGCIQGLRSSDFNNPWITSAA